MLRNAALGCLIITLAACGGPAPTIQPPLDGGTTADGGDGDAGTTMDAGSTTDSGMPEGDGGSGSDGGSTSDGGASSDGGEPDAGLRMDGGLADAGASTDAGPGDAGAGLDAGALCTSDAQCITTSEACIFGRCARVDEQTTTYPLQVSIESLGVAYDGAQPKVAFAYNDSAISGYSHFIAFGPFGTRMNVNTGLWSDAVWSLSRERGAAPWVSWVTSLPGKYGIAMGSSSNGVVYNTGDRVASFATARNAAGDEFIAAALAVGTACEVRFAQRPSGGAWTAPVTILPCGDEYSVRVQLHVFADGTPSILLTESGAPGKLELLTRSSPLSWSRQSLLPNLSRPSMVLVQERDGLSEVLFWNVTFSSSASNGDYDVRLLRLEDGQLTRSVAIGNFPAQPTVPFQSFDVSGDGTAWLLRAGTGSSSFSPVNVTRVDAATGALTTQQLGTVVRGPYSRTAIGVSAGGELAILHAEDLRHLLLRRLIPR